MFRSIRQAHRKRFEAHLLAEVEEVYPQRMADIGAALETLGIKRDPSVARRIRYRWFQLLDADIEFSRRNAELKQLPPSKKSASMRQDLFFEAARRNLWSAIGEVTGYAA